MIALKLIYIVALVLSSNIFMMARPDANSTKSEIKSVHKIQAFGVIEMIIGIISLTLINII